MISLPIAVFAVALAAGVGFLVGFVTMAVMAASSIASREEEEWNER